MYNTVYLSARPSLYKLVSQLQLQAPLQTSVATPDYQNVQTPVATPSYQNVQTLEGG